MAAFLIVAVWFVPRPVGDLYVALAGGRDVLAGKLAGPDDWSFMTVIPGTDIHRVWINQNWGTHVIDYLTYLAAGDTGLLVLKMALLWAAAFFMVQAARQRGVKLPLALVTAGLILAGGRAFIDLRPNLTTLTMAPLIVWLLYRARGSPRRIWLVAAMVWLWANVHGGFILGLAMMALWTACQLGLAMIIDKPGPALRRYWHLPAATAAAILISGAASPFFIRPVMESGLGAIFRADSWINLAHPFVVATSKEWQTVSEWQSIFVPGGFGSKWEFIVCMGTLGALALVRLFTDLFASSAAKSRGPRAQTVALAIFALGAPIAVIFLASRAEVNPVDVAIWETIHRIQWIIGGAAVLALVAVIRLLLGLSKSYFGVVLAQSREAFKHPGAKLPELSTFVFEALLGIVAIAMAVKSRRFEPLAMIIVAPFLASQFAWLFNPANRWAFLGFGAAVDAVVAAVVLWDYNKTGRFEPLPVVVAAPFLAAQFTWLFYRHNRWVILGFAAGALAPGAVLLWNVLPMYRRDNPILPPGSIADRMHMTKTLYSQGLAQFINDNKISGRVFAEWRWEGFLRWRCPQLRTFIGGRAQQVYDVETFKLSQETIISPSGVGILATYDVHLVAMPGGYPLVDNLVKSGWAIVYFDGGNFLLADPRKPEFADLIRLAAGRGPNQAPPVFGDNGELKYPDPKEETKALSRAMCLATAGSDPDVLMSAFKEANRLRPTFFIYQQVLNLLVSQVRKATPEQRAGFLASSIRYLEEENSRLEKLDLPPSVGGEYLRCRLRIMTVLFEFYRAANRQQDSARALETAKRLEAQLGQLVHKWG